VSVGGRLFERNDNLAGAVYGTILVTSIVAAADASPQIWRSLAIVVVTTIVFWLAHVYAHSLAVSLDEHQHLSFAEVRRVGTKEWPLLQAAVIPSLALFAGGVGLVSVKAAYWIAIGYGVAALLWWGLLFARKERLSLVGTSVVLLVNTLFGVFVILLKAIVSHH